MYKELSVGQRKALDKYFKLVGKYQTQNVVITYMKFNPIKVDGKNSGYVYMLPEGETLDSITYEDDKGKRLLEPFKMDIRVFKSLHDKGVIIDNSHTGSENYYQLNYQRLAREFKKSKPNHMEFYNNYGKYFTAIKGSY